MQRSETGLVVFGFIMVLVEGGGYHTPRSAEHARGAVPPTPGVFDKEFGIA